MANFVLMGYGFMNDKMLIADAGGTSTSWAIVCPDGCSVHRFDTGPINSGILSAEQVKNEIESALTGKDVAGIGKIFFYGAGCASEIQISKVRDGFSSLFPEGTDIEVYSDLVGAARSVLLSERGVACILGTGSAAGLYDGVTIERVTPSLGYILGDEGSGAAIGKRILNAVYKGLWPDSLVDDFYRRYRISIGDLIENVYRRPFANKYLASFVPFAVENIYDDNVRTLVIDELNLFFERNVDRYREYSSEIGFVGGVAMVFSDLLREVASAHGFRVREVVSSPIDGLVKYHTNN